MRFQSLPKEALRKYAWHFSVVAPEEYRWEGSSYVDYASRGLALEGNETYADSLAEKCARDFVNRGNIINEEAVLMTFSGYTRSLVGEPVTEIDDEADRRRYQEASGRSASWWRQVAEESPRDGEQSKPAYFSSSNNEPAASNSGGPNNAQAKDHHEEASAAAGAALAAEKVAPSRKRSAGSSSTSAPSTAALASGSNQTLAEGRRVVAKSGGDYIMMVVVGYVKRTRQYVLRDADDQVTTKKDEHTVARNLVIPLPDPASGEARALTVGTRVLGLFPGTTTFYPAVISKVIKRKAPTSAADAGSSPSTPPAPLNDYQLCFDDDDEDDVGNIIPRRVKGELVVEAPASSSGRGGGNGDAAGSVAGGD